ncbi:hypothetical protein [Saccharothrix xinjiangensis]|uniref:Uncharacterized protein n=1 Tax=Saccharothrix xinjiangensis TaxID=204798 RepID=A0ABV9Y727_9PSEU
MGDVKVHAALKVIAGSGALVLGVLLIVGALSKVSVDAEVVGVEGSGAQRSPWRPVVRFTTAEGRSVTVKLPKEVERRQPGIACRSATTRKTPRRPTTPTTSPRWPSTWVAG